MLFTVTVRELLASGRIVRVYLDELGEIEQLPIGIGLMVLTKLEGDAAKTEARSAIERSGGNLDIIELIYSERLETGLFRITLHLRLLEEVGDVSSKFWLVKSNV